MANDFSIVKKGYDTKEVREHINSLEKELSSYKAKEQFISQALLDAQATAQGIIKTAEKSAVHMEYDALLKLEHIRKKIDYSKIKLDDFQSKYNQFIEHFTKSFNNDDLGQLFANLDEIANSLKVK